MALTFKALGVDEINRRLAKLPEGVARVLKQQLKTEVDAMVGAMKRVAPDDPVTGGSRIRDAIRAYPNPDRVISYRIISDGKDEKGQIIAAHVEHGHKTPEGGHVPPRPTFFPVYRALKTPMRRRLMAAARKEVRDAFPGSST